MIFLARKNSSSNFAKIVLSNSIKRRIKIESKCVLISALVAFILTPSICILYRSGLQECLFRQIIKIRFLWKGSPRCFKRTQLRQEGFSDFLDANYSHEATFERASIAAEAAHSAITCSLFAVPG